MKILLGLTVAASLFVAGCGGGSKTSTATTSTILTPTAARQAYRQCLASHGVQLPQRGQTQFQAPDSSTPPTTASPAVQAARQACAKLRPAGGFGGGLGRAGQANTPQAQAYRNCLQQHGVTFSSTPTGGFNFNDPNFQAAQKACAGLRPTFNSTSTSTTIG